MVVFPASALSRNAKSAVAQSSLNRRLCMQVLGSQGFFELASNRQGGGSQYSHWMAVARKRSEQGLQWQRVVSTSRGPCALEDSM